MLSFRNFGIRRLSTALTLSAGPNWMAFRSASTAVAQPSSPSKTSASVESADEPNEEGFGQCLLCDTEYTEWRDHARSRYHRARHAVCSALVNPDKHAAILQQIWENIQLDFNVIEEVNSKKISRRRSRLTSTLTFLRDSNAIKHSSLEGIGSSTEQSDSDAAAGAGNFSIRASKEFTKFVALGEPCLRFEVTDRVARLFPKCSLADLSVISQMVLHIDHVEGLYDFLKLNVLSGPELVAALDQGDIKLNTSEKAAVVFALVGELSEFVHVERPHNVGTKEVADRLVLNVLATHALENIVSELVHFVLQKIVDEGTPVWKEYKATLPKLMRQTSSIPRATIPLASAPAPLDLQQIQLSRDVMATDLSSLGELQTKPNASGDSDVPAGAPVKPTMQELVRSCAMTVTVPNPMKAAYFASPMPKLALKPKSGTSTPAPSTAKK